MSEKEKKVEQERIYVVPLKRALVAPRTKRSPKGDDFRNKDEVVRSD
jgi:ribosomal protein L31E